MSFSNFSDISQNDAEILEEQYCKIQQRHKEKQQLIVHLEEVAEAYHVKCTVQKARKEIEAKMREEAKKQRLVEKKEKKK